MIPAVFLALAAAGELHFAEYAPDLFTGAQVTVEHGPDGYVPLHVTGVVTFDVNMTPAYEPGASCSEAWMTIERLLDVPYAGGERLAEVFIVLDDRLRAGLSCENALRYFALWADNEIGLGLAGQCQTEMDD